MLVLTANPSLGIKAMKPEKENSEYLKEMDSVIQILTLRAMAAGNDGDFETAFSTMELALWMSQSLEKKCLEAALLNNLGLLFTMQGAWDNAMLTFDRSMEMAIASCHSHDHLLTILKKNISCLFDPKINPPGRPKSV